MSCPAQTVIASAVANGFESLDDRSILLCMIGALLPGAGNPSASTVLSNAVANGFESADDRMIAYAMAQFLCGP